MIMYFIQRPSISLKINQQRTSYNLNLVLLIWTLALLIVFSSVSGTGGSDLSCHKLKAVLESRKFKDNQFTRESISGESQFVYHENSQSWVRDAEYCWWNGNSFLVQFLKLFNQNLILNYEMQTLGLLLEKETCNDIISHNLSWFNLLLVAMWQKIKCPAVWCKWSVINKYQMGIDVQIFPSDI